MKKRLWLAIGVMAMVALAWYVYWHVTTLQLGEYYQTTLINKTREEAEQAVGAPPNRYWKKAELAGTTLDPAVEAVGHWYTNKGTIGIAFDKSGKAISVNFDPSIRREGSTVDHLFYLIGW